MIMVKRLSRFACTNGMVTHIMKNMPIGGMRNAECNSDWDVFLIIMNTHLK